MPVVKDLKYEEHRLETFATWPSNAPVTSDKIARAGFFYTGTGLEVQCYFCDKKLHTWTYADQVMLRHRLLNPTCPFVLKPLSSGNIIINKISNHSNKKDNFRSNSITANRDNVASSKDMTNGLNRLRTFFSDRNFIPVQMYLLAVNGFYSINSNDNVKCVGCGLIVKDWLEKLDPITLHKEERPKCPQNSKIFLDSIEEYENLDCVEGAFSEEYSKFKCRLATYKGWPHKNPDPMSLSFAGLYFTKEGDSLRCYYCDIGLRQWLRTDNPLVEHGRSAPTCKFMIQLTSKTFIQMCLDYAENSQAKMTPSPENINKLEAEIRDLKESRMCKICLDEEIAIAFVPCGHLLTCEKCSIGLTSCPLCRGQIFNTVRTYLS